MTVDVGRKLAIIRRGHMGDVLLTEPIVTALKTSYGHVTIFTDYPHAADLLEVFDVIRPYDDHLSIRRGEFDRTIGLKYEIYSGLNHLDGYAADAGVVISHRVPRIRRRFQRLREEPYGLIAPSVSSWIKPMREWSRRRFDQLADHLRQISHVPVFTLEPDDDFETMLALIQHCAFFVGNDSGPAILAQCFARPSFVIFGATTPRLVLLREDAVGISKDVGCNGCKHYARHTDIECASPFCLDQLTVDEVVHQMLSAGWLR